MVNLIKNEFIKLIKKKSTLIILIIFLLYIVFTNFMVKYMSKYMRYDYRSDESYINFAKEELSKINPNEDPINYINYKNDIDLYELLKKYDKNSWQEYIIERDFYVYINDINTYKYGTNAQKLEIEGNPEEKYNAKLKLLEKDDWKEFVKEEIDVVNKDLEDMKAQYDEVKILNENIDTQELQNLSIQIKGAENKRDLLQFRLDQSIPYGNNFMNDAIQIMEESSQLDYDYNKKELSYNEKVQKQNEIQNYEKAKYIIENKQDINNTTNLRGILMDVFSGYSIFIIVFIVMIAGTIISSEFEKGTIKILLVKPHKRWKILLSKYIVSLIMMLFILIFTVLMQTLIGGIILGFDSLKVPVVEYSFNSNSLVSYNIFYYVFIIALHKLPMFILLTTLAFAISAIFVNNAISIVIPILGNMAGAIINEILIQFSVKQLKFFPTLNWDLTEFLFGKLPSYEYTNFKFAIMISVMYLVIMLVSAFVAFQKRQIKNI